MKGGSGSRWVLTLLGTVLLGGAAWMLAPLLPALAPVLPRVLLLQSLLVVWALGNALLEWRRRSREAVLGAGLAGTTAGTANEEAAAVGVSLTRALALARESGMREHLLRAPWYAIIGPPGAGKTTALLNAGLSFPLSERIRRAPAAGVGGTRLCDWWFTDGAVLIDTAGRYTTQDSDAAVDRAGWDAFLALLRRTRPREPLNGLIVAIGIPDLVGSAAERDAHAAAVRRRIAELQERLGVRIPVYVLFTKIDLVAGFSEFFDGLSREQRDQVWGETVAPGAEGPAGERFAAVFRALAGRLEAHLLPRLGAERRPERRTMLAGFPTQFGSLEKPLAAFTAAAFPPDGTWLRGIYFASGTQEGTPIDRLAGVMARGFGLGRERIAALRPEAGRSFFLGQLLREVILGEAMLVRDRPEVVRRRRRGRIAGFVAVGLVFAAGAGTIVLGYREAGRGVDAVAAALNGYERATAGTVPYPVPDPVSDGDLRPLAAMLDRARTLADGVPAAGAAAERLRMNQDGELRAAAAAAYRHGLVYGLLPRLVWRIEARLRGSLSRPDDDYELTRLYLMLGGAGPLDASLVRGWMVRDWQDSFPSPNDDALRASLSVHLDRLLAEPLPPVTLDTALVAAARAGFGGVSLAERSYATLRGSAQAVALPSWRPIDVLGPAGAQVFTRASGRSMSDGIPGLYTAAGYAAVVAPSIDAVTRRVAAESWVSGRRTEFAASELRDLRREVEARYAADLEREWSAMLGDLSIEPPANVEQAAQSLYVLASPESPLRALVRSVATALRLPLPVDPADAAPLSAAMARFAPLVALGGGDGIPLDRSLRLVADIQQQLAKIAALPIGSALPAGGADIAAALDADAVRQPQPVAGWLQAVGADALALRVGDLRQQLVLGFDAPGGPAQSCREAVTHEPFDPNGSPLPLDQFARVFGPGGAIDGYFNTRLKPFVTATGGNWKAQAIVPMDDASLNQFRRAALIRDAFFPGGRAAPAVSFEIAPVGGGGGNGRDARLEIGGITVRSGDGPSHAAILTWPEAGAAAATGDGSASLTVDPAQAPFPLREAGPWALFKLFAHGRLSAPDRSGRQRLEFPASPPIDFELRLGEAANPFAPGLLSGFRCPVTR